MGPATGPREFAICQKSASPKPSMERKYGTPYSGLIWRFALAVPGSPHSMNLRLVGGDWLSTWYRAVTPRKGGYDWVPSGCGGAGWATARSKKLRLEPSTLSW